MSNAMFKRFSMESVQSQNQTKQSQQRAIRLKLAEQFPALGPDEWEDIMPKKDAILVVKCQGHINLIVLNGRVLFFQERDGPFMPVLRLLHQYPMLLPRMRVDIGGCKFVISGANVMCPGLTSAGGFMDDVPSWAPVAIYVEGKEHAVAVGVTKMSSEEIRKVNKGHGIENVHYLGDGLWHNPIVEN
eukprot:NODE_3268_length_1011_cov_31.961538_g3006_i0.p2 GENE.NODE_3268_length_1011_cov_31.961538_g3006_i0~~NODE_3268_length_1011_cov_31.961538_g3006_i0.p2  ORF type:complete len:187 (-),score=37.56 NODE_3268_length_1011_cov_31.961538_g3006_i0:268-828(-)